MKRGINMNAIGIDIGGMSIKVGLVDELGQVRLNFVMPINREMKGETIIDQLIQEINGFIVKNNIDPASIKGIGVGCPGIINSKDGVISYSANLKFIEYPLAKVLESGTGFPVKVTNDANAATLGEARFGCGKKYRDVIMITIGTGIGGGIVVDGKLIEGHEGKGAELGHISLIQNGELCGCGRKGCFEAYASATALIRQTKDAMKKNPDTILWKYVDGNITKVDGKMPFDAAKANDPVGVEIVDKYISYLGDGLLNYMNIFRPEIIVLSGGVSKQGSYLIDRLIQYAEAHNYGYPHSPKVEIKCAELGYESGIVGAACLQL